MESTQRKCPTRSEKSAPAEFANFKRKGKDVVDYKATPGSSVHAMEDCNGWSERAESVASECSEASDAQSVDRTNLDAVASGRILQRCSSGGSIVTYDGAPSDLRGKSQEEGERERICDRQPSLRLEGATQSQSQLLGYQRESHEVQKIDQSGGPGWTEDKHCSYLNSIEQTFVNSMYGQDYRTVEGSDDQDCVESRPMYGAYRHGGELFTSLQRGCYDQREYYRPHFLHVPFPYSPAIFHSPWIQHFNPKVSAPAVYGGPPVGQEGSHGVAGTSANVSYGTADANNCVDPDREVAKEEVMESFPKYLEANKVLQNRNSRHQGHHTDVSGGVQGKKRAGNGEVCGDPIYRPKKLKNTQRLLAAIDVEMEEQFVLKQKNLEEQAEPSGVKLNGIEYQGENLGGLDLNRPLDLNCPFDQPGEMGCQKETSFGIQKVQSAPSPVRTSQDPTDTNIPASNNITAVNLDEKIVEEDRDLLEGKTEESRAFKRVNASGNGSIGSQQNFNDDAAATASGKSEREMDEEIDIEFLPRKSPCASKTYTWGASGPRRRLQKECNTSDDAA